MPLSASKAADGLNAYKMPLLRGKGEKTTPLCVVWYRRGTIFWRQDEAKVRHLARQRHPFFPEKRRFLYKSAQASVLFRQSAQFAQFPKSIYGSHGVYVQGQQLFANSARVLVGVEDLQLQRRL